MFSTCILFWSGIMSSTLVMMELLFLSVNSTISPFINLTESLSLIKVASTLSIS